MIDQNTSGLTQHNNPSGMWQRGLAQTLLLFGFFVFYIVWLHRAYFDVAYMDQMQVLAGNIKHMYNHDTTLQDFYYRSPFLLFFSTILTYVNCKLFGFNTMLENIITGVTLLLIGLYYLRASRHWFTPRARIYLAFLSGLVIFSLSKWELSLWSGGYSHYIVVFFGFICVNLAHRHYLNPEPGVAGPRKNYLPVYIALAMAASLETASYFLPFLASILIILLVNFRIFRERVDTRKWKTMLFTTIALLFFALLINYLADRYAGAHTYDGYGKTTLGQSLGGSFSKIAEEPWFVTKFFLISQSCGLVDKDIYSPASFAIKVLPFLGLIVFGYFCFAFFLFTRKKIINGWFSINLMLYCTIFLGLVLLGRLSFNDVYYGASSRYSAATFTGLLGLCSFFLMLLQRKGVASWRGILYSFPLLLVLLCVLNVNKEEWRMAPYRKAFYSAMADNMKGNQDLNSLQAYNAEITGVAREMMIRNKLNVFKPEHKLTAFSMDVNLNQMTGFGFLPVEKNEQGFYRWTDGNATVLLPNLYTVTDTIRVSLKCYIPHVDTPNVILNDRLLPFQVVKDPDGYTYSYAFQEQKVLFNAIIRNKSFVPSQEGTGSTDTRKLGLIFQSLQIRQ